MVAITFRATGSKTDLLDASDGIRALLDLDADQALEIAPPLLDLLLALDESIQEAVSKTRRRLFDLASLESAE
jgi:hypothetical protein